MPAALAALWKRSEAHCRVNGKINVLGARLAVSCAIHDWGNSETISRCDLQQAVHPTCSWEPGFAETLGRAIDELRKNHDVNAFGKLMDQIMNDIQCAALTDFK